MNTSINAENDTFDTNEQNIDEVAHEDSNNDPKMEKSQQQFEESLILVQNNEFSNEEEGKYIDCLF